MERLSLVEIIKYLGAEVRDGISREYLKFGIVDSLDDSAFGLQYNIDYKIEVIKNLDNIIDIVLYYEGNKEFKINSILNEELEVYIEDDNCNQFKVSQLILEIVETGMRMHTMIDPFEE